MDSLLSVFDFSSQSLGKVFARFGLELFLTVMLAYLVAVIILAFTKKKKHEIGFSNWFKVCFMYGLDASIILLGVIVILTISSNGLYYFYANAIAWNWYCGYLLMIPEILIIIGLVCAYWILNKQIYKSIN